MVCSALQKEAHWPKCSKTNLKLINFRRTLQKAWSQSSDIPPDTVPPCHSAHNCFSWSISSSCTVHCVGNCQIMTKNYHKVPSRLSWLVAHQSIFRRFMMGKFDASVLWLLAQRVQNWIADGSTARSFTVQILFLFI